LSQDAAKTKAESIIKKDFPDYVKLALKWHDFSRWSVVKVVGERKEIGAIVALPVNEAFYLKVKSGEAPSYDCESKDMRIPTACLIMEGLALRPREECDRTFEDTRAMLYAVACQNAYLTTLPGIGWEIPLRILSFAGTNANRRRLRWVGYRSTGERMRETNVDLFEREFYLAGNLNESVLDEQILGVWWKLQAELRSQGFTGNDKGH
jgi:hypothetical protein